MLTDLNIEKELEAKYSGVNRETAGFLSFIIEKTKILTIKASLNAGFSISSLQYSFEAEKLGLLDAKILKHEITSLDSISEKWHSKAFSFFVDEDYNFNIVLVGLTQKGNFVLTRIFSPIHWC